MIALSAHDRTTAATGAFLPSDYNLILFFSLPFYPVSKTYKKNFTYGHLSLAIGETLYQLHDPARLRSSFLVSRMPTVDWLFSDGPWFDPDPCSPTYRHVHLYETAEIQRTVIFFAALKNFPASRQRSYRRYLEQVELSFHGHRFRFHLLCNNCTHALNNIFYREGWFSKGPFDFIPVIAFKKFVTAITRCGIPCALGYLQANNHQRFRINPVCIGLFTLAPRQHLIRWLSRFPGFIGSVPAGTRHAS